MGLYAWYIVEDGGVHIGRHLCYVGDGVFSCCWCILCCRMMDVPHIMLLSFYTTLILLKFRDALCNLACKCLAMTCSSSSIHVYVAYDSFLEILSRLRRLGFLLEFYAPCFLEKCRIRTTWYLVIVLTTEFGPFLWNSPWGFAFDVAKTARALMLQNCHRPRRVAPHELWRDAAGPCLPRTVSVLCWLWLFFLLLVLALMWNDVQNHWIKCWLSFRNILYHTA